MFIDASGREALRFVVAICQPLLVATGKLFFTVLD
jgi:hypothetical protein